MKEDHLNIRHLMAMTAVVRSGSISAAVRSVNLTQPAITQGIAKLEAQLGASLFDRMAGGMAPTPAARLLVSRADNALRLIGSKHATAAECCFSAGTAASVSSEAFAVADSSEEGVEREGNGDGK